MISKGIKDISLRKQAGAKMPFRDKGTMFKRALIAALCLLHAAIIGLAVAVICLHNNQNDYLSINEQAQVLLQGMIIEQQDEILQQKETISQLERAFSSKQNTTVDVETDVMLRQIEEQQAILEKREDELSEMKELLSSIGRKIDGSVVYFKKYTVVKGDYLRLICRKNDLGYLANRKVILGINGIKDEDMIIVGQTILLPALIELEK